MFKKLSLLLIVLALALPLGIASAQDEDRPTPGRHVARQLAEIIVDETDLAMSELLALLFEDDMTMAEIITANGGDVDVVATRTIEVITNRINEAVANGELPQERADQILENLEQSVYDGLNSELEPPRANLRDRLLRQHRNTLMQVIVDTTGLQPREILRELRVGGTLADMITANGGNVDTVIDTAIANATTEIQGWVAEERITQEQADDMIASLDTLFTEMVNHEFEPRNNPPSTDS